MGIGVSVRYTSLGAICGTDKEKSIFFDDTTRRMGKNRIKRQANAMDTNVERLHDRYDAVLSSWPLSSHIEASSEIVLPDLVQEIGTCRVTRKQRNRTSIYHHNNVVRPGFNGHMQCNDFELLELDMQRCIGEDIIMSRLRRSRPRVRRYITHANSILCCGSD